MDKSNEKDIIQTKDISQAVITRLPRYFRYLGELKDAGVERISSQELSRIMRVTASQIRQDLNHFGCQIVTVLEFHQINRFFILIHTGYGNSSGINSCCYILITLGKRIGTLGIQCHIGKNTLQEL